jgi:hypothetical protein
MVLNLILPLIRLLATFLFNNYNQVQDLLDNMPTMIVTLQFGKTPEDTEYHEHLEVEHISAIT